MNKARIGERILNGIRKNSEGDTVVQDFLVELIYEEAQRSGRWHWKSEYRNLIKQYAEKWGGQD